MEQRLGRWAPDILSEEQQQCSHARIAAYNSLLVAGDIVRNITSLSSIKEIDKQICKKDLTRAILPEGIYLGGIADGIP